MHPHQTDIFQDQEPLSVAEYIDLLNAGLRKFEARIKGEVTEFNPRSSYLFFTLKDKGEEGVINCFMWQSNYKLFGIDLKEGLEIVVSGYPAVYAKSGRLSFQASTIELVGEGALKKAYEELKKKLSKEGIFAPERKRPIPKYSRNIGVITSKTGAVIHDFTNNLSRCGFKIKLIDSRVEGQQAVKDILRAIKTFERKDIDVLVIMRGGGSLESLMAFNNEQLVRRVSGFPVPVIAAIGHEKDKPLVAMAADAMVSTPTAAANLLSEPWEKARLKVDHLEKSVLHTFNKWIFEAQNHLSRKTFDIRDEFRKILDRYKKIENIVLQSMAKIKNRLKEEKTKIANYYRSVRQGFSSVLQDYQYQIKNLENIVNINNPERQLGLGYSIVRLGGKIVKSIKNVKIGKEIDIQLIDGTVKSDVKKITKQKNG